MKATLIAGLVLVATQVGIGAQDSLTAAKDLYARPLTKTHCRR
jgi:hypothetical protein